MQLVLALWLAQLPGAPDAGVSGEAVFRAHCAQCHSLDGAVGTAPSLRGVYGSTVKLVGGKTVVADEAYLRESVLKPAAKIVDGFLPIMPVFKNVLTTAEVDAVVAFVRGATDGGVPATSR